MDAQGKPCTVAIITPKHGPQIHCSRYFNKWHRYLSGIIH